MDRFGYAKTVDVSTYERNKEAADNENKYILHCMNTGRICIFTKDGKMHQVKVMDLPYGKFRDKGQPIDNISNYDSTQEEIVYICDSEQMRYANLLFATKQGMVKKVGGSEFQVTKRTIAATKLQPEDEVVNIRVVTENQHIVLQTADGFFLRFPAAEVTETKKGAIGVRGHVQKGVCIVHGKLPVPGKVVKRIISCLGNVKKGFVFDGVTHDQGKVPGCGLMNTSCICTVQAV